MIDLHQLVVLYVEDEARSRTVMRMLARDLAISQLTIFEDSADFMPRVEVMSPPPDLIFLDIHVQPINGFEMLQQLKQSGLFTDTPIVAMTASVMNEEIEHLRAAGFDGCLAKPIDIDTFPDMLRRILSGETVWRIAL